MLEFASNVVMKHLSLIRVNPSSGQRLARDCSGFGERYVDLGRSGEQVSHL